MDTLYHYTTVEALLHMLKDDGKIRFWATRHDYLNDGEELKKGVELINHFIPKIEREFEIEEIKKISSYVQELGEALINGYRTGNAGFYITSFSEESDALTMWRMYGSDCNGIAIGLDFQTIDKDCSILENLEKGKFRKVVYEGEANIEKKIREIYETWQTLMPEKGSDLANEYANIINYLCIYIKSHYFAYEKEWRITLYDWDVRPKDIEQPQFDISTQFRCKNGIIIPYKEITLPIKALKSITLGPTYDIDRSRNSLEIFLRSKNVDINQIDIRKSDAPYKK